MTRPLSTFIFIIFTGKAGFEIYQNGLEIKRNKVNYHHFFVLIYYSMLTRQAFNPKKMRQTRIRKCESWIIQGNISCHLLIIIPLKG